MYISAQLRAIKELGAHQSTKVWTLYHYKKRIFCNKKHAYQSRLGFMTIRDTLIDQRPQSKKYSSNSRVIRDVYIKQQLLYTKKKGFLIRKLLGNKRISGASINHILEITIPFHHPNVWLTECRTRQQRERMFNYTNQSKVLQKRDFTNDGSKSFEYKQ